MIDYKFINNNFKGNKITKLNNVVIISDNENKYIIKEKTKNLNHLFNYLSSRGYDSYPIFLNNKNTDNNIFVYENELNIPKNQKLYDYATTVGLLHNKTVYFKDISIDKIKEVRDIIESNIDYIHSYYEKFCINALKYEYMSPSLYLFSRNYYKINRLLNNAKNELNNWYSIKEKNPKTRICLIHNNLKLDHYIASERKILISWDNYDFDNPILDIVTLYKNEYLKVDFNIFYDRYTKVFTLKEEELLLFYIMISIPNEIKLSNKEIENIKIIRELIEYIDKTEKLIRPYYLNKQKE